MLNGTNIFVIGMMGAGKRSDGKTFFHRRRQPQPTITAD
jgi:shikimate kinase